jgi:hypothetical protein
VRASRILPTVVCSPATVVVIAVTPAAAQLEWSSKDESASLKIGVLAQLQAESAEVAGTDDEAQNLFIRRLRLIANFNLGKELSFFAQTDSPNIGKSTNDGTKNSGDIFIQDAVATWKFSQLLHIDGGLLLPAQSYNHNTSAASLLALDYGPFTFVESGPTESRTGRDYGVRARGYLFDDHLEYRAGVYQGERGDGASNEFRYTGRLMMQWFTPQTGLFYRGTSLGKTKTLSFGGSIDTQEDYEWIGADMFFEQPFGGGNGFVLQADWARIDGDVFLPTLAERTTLLVESGIYLGSLQVQPFVQYASQDMDDDALSDEDRYSVGLAFLPGGHRNNLKLAFTRIDPSTGESSDQINLQWQLFQF